MKRFVILFVLIIFFAGCSDQGKIINDFQSIQRQIREKFAPDKSLAFVNFELTRRNKTWVLKGETTVPQAHSELTKKLDSLLSKNFTDSSVILPHPELGDSIYGIVRVSVANIRREPRHPAELIDQSIMGNELKLLKKKGSWYLIRTNYGYIGWMTKYSFWRTDENGIADWEKSKQVMVYYPVDRIFSRPDPKSIPVCDVVMNSTLKFIAKKGKWILAETPDQRRGYLLAAHAGPVVPVKSPSGVKPEDLVKTAYQLMGIPYFWGGNSSKGSDCSGFTQTVFRANGIQLPRDARQQVLMGKEIIPEDDFSNVKPGDLLFFGLKDRITHVGMSLGGYKFIHQDREVRVNSLNERDENFNGYRKKTLKKIKRILK